MNPAAPPHDRPIRVMTREEGLWVGVIWSGQRFEVIDGGGSWIEAAEVQDCKEAAHPAIGIGRPATEA